MNVLPYQPIPLKEVSMCNFLYGADKLKVLENIYTPLCPACLSPPRLDSITLHGNISVSEATRSRGRERDVKLGCPSCTSSLSGVRELYFGKW